MKKKHIVAAVLLFVGTNLFTYATTRYLTTKHVIGIVDERLSVLIEKEGLLPWESPGRPLRQVTMHAGGMYYWGNTAGWYWVISGLILFTGVLVPFVESRRPNSRESD
jgi:hypothetical protein